MTDIYNEDEYPLYFRVKCRNKEEFEALEASGLDFELI